MQKGMGTTDTSSAFPSLRRSRRDAASSDGDDQSFHHSGRISLAAQNACPRDSVNRVLPTCDDITVAFTHWTRAVQGCEQAATVQMAMTVV